MSDPLVLVVEDDGAIRSLLVAALRREPLEVHTASDGVAALDCVRVNDYAVILLDLMMPRLNGYEFLETLDAVRPDAEPVIIVMTAFDSAGLRTIRSNRVQAVLHKPFDVDRVVDMVRDCALLRAEARSDGSGTRSNAAPPPLDAPDEDSKVC